MKTLVAKLTGKHSQEDPINLHVTVFWATVAFWAVTLICFGIVKALA